MFLLDQREQWLREEAEKEKRQMDSRFSSVLFYKIKFTRTKEESRKILGLDYTAGGVVAGGRDGG